MDNDNILKLKQNEERNTTYLIKRALIDNILTNSIF